MDLTFNICKSKGIISIKDLNTDSIFSSLTELSSKFHLPGSHLFRFSNLETCQKELSLFPNWPPENLLDALLAVNPKQRKCISVMYNLLWLTTSEPLNLIWSVWENDLSIVLC